MTRTHLNRLGSFALGAGGASTAYRFGVDLSVSAVIGLGVLVFLVGLFGYATGSIAEMERERSREKRAGGDPVPGDD